jgi:hypothetical protein
MAEVVFDADQIDQIKSSLTGTCEAIIGGTRGVLGNSRRRSVDPGSEFLPQMPLGV